MKIARLPTSIALVWSLGLLVACEGSVHDGVSGSQVRDRLVASMDCDEQLVQIKALSSSVPEQETYRRLDDLVKAECSTHQSVLEERFVIASLYRIGATPDELIRGIDWRASSNREFLWALSLATIKKNLASPSAEDVLTHFESIAPLDFLPRVLRARLFQRNDDFDGVDRELRAAEELLGAGKSELFQGERAQLAPIYFFEGHMPEAYEMSMDFVKLFGEEAWNSPNMIGIAAMSAIDVGKPDEAKMLLDKLRQRNAAGVADPAIAAAQAKLELEHPELLQ